MKVFILTLFEWLQPKIINDHQLCAGQCLQLSIARSVVLAAFDLGQQFCLSGKQQIDADTGWAVKQSSLRWCLRHPELNCVLELNANVQG
jgi:hypothetical protein